MPLLTSQNTADLGEITPKKIPARGWKTHTVMMIHNDRIEDNDVDETGYEGLSSGSDGVAGQAPLGRQPATGRRKWNNAVNRVVMECYFESEPTVRGYRKRMLSAWRCLITESSSPWHSAPPQTGARGLRL